MKDGFFEDEDLKSPGGIARVVIIILLSVFMLFSCTSSKKVEKLPPSKNVTATLDGSQSYDPDGYIVDWKWKQVAGPSASIINPKAGITTTTLSKKGNYSFELTVTDNDGAMDRDTTHIKY